MSDEWFDAVRNGNGERVAELLAQQPDLIDREDNFRENALHCAARGGHERVVARLLAARPALVHTRDSRDWTALEISASEGEAKIVALLLATDGVTREEITAGLCSAAVGGHPEVVDLLLRSRPGLIFNEPDQNAVITLLSVVESGHERVFTQLIAACPGLIDSTATAALHRAASHGHESLVAQILALRPEAISGVNRHGWNAVMFAVEAGHQRIAENLLAIQPTLICQVNDNGNTVLHYAVTGRCSDFQFVGKLWRMHPQALTHVNNIASPGRTPFQYAILCKKNELIEMFQWSLPFGEIVDAFTKLSLGYEERYRPLMEQQCELLFRSLNQDMAGTVFEYLGFAPFKRKSGRSSLVGTLLKHLGFARVKSS